MQDLNYRRREGMIRAMWCVDSETADEVLIDVDTNQVIARRIKGKLVDPNEVSHE